MIPSRRNADACILHACDVSFTIAKLAMGVSAIYGFVPVEKYETLPILPFIFYLLTPKMLPFSFFAVEGLSAYELHKNHFDPNGYT
jgi:hypothetical protein